MKLPDYVEAHVTGIRIDEKLKTIDIFFRLQNGDHTSLRAEGVTHFVANGFRERNIVDRVNVWNSQNQPDEFRAPLIELLTGEMGGLMLEAFLPAIDIELSAIAKGEKILVEIEPVYGAGAIFLARMLMPLKSD
jgi:hypothetical protein